MFGEHVFKIYFQKGEKGTVENYRSDVAVSILIHG